jgi:hypothetical protein
MSHLFQSLGALFVYLLHGAMQRGPNLSSSSLISTNFIFLTSTDTEVASATS